MTDVIAWPPVGLTAFEITKIDPVSVSKSLINSRPYVSRFGRSRRVATNVATGFGQDAAGAGYMEMFKEYLEGGSNLIRLDITSSIWHYVRASDNPLLSNAKLNWTSENNQLFWTTNGVDTQWYLKDFPATITTDKGFPAIEVSNLPPNMVVIRPHEIVSVYTSPTIKESSRALKVCKSNADGVAIIRVKDAFSSGGQVILGDTESVVFRHDGPLPRAVQPQSGDWSYEWRLTEAFEDEYESWNEVNPWQ